MSCRGLVSKLLRVQVRSRGATRALARMIGFAGAGGTLIHDGLRVAGGRSLHCEYIPSFVSRRGNKLIGQPCRRE